MKRALHLGWLFLALSYATAQVAPVEVRQVQVLRDGTQGVKIEIALTGSITPSVETAKNPERLILILPGTTSDARQKRLSVNANGVRAVRYGLHQSSPPETRVVVDLDSEHGYTLASDGNKLIVTFPTNEVTASNRRRSGAVPAASAPITSVFRRPQAAPTAPATSGADNASIPAAPPSRPPLNFPGDTASPATQTANSNSAPSAKNPKKGSLAEGTVFPGMGTPGTGSVPPTVGDKTNPPAFDQNAAAAATAGPQTVVPATSQAPSSVTVSVSKPGEPTPAPVQIAPAPTAPAKTEAQPAVVATMPSPAPATPVAPPVKTPEVVATTPPALPAANAGPGVTESDKASTPAIPQSTPAIQAAIIPAAPASDAAAQPAELAPVLMTRPSSPDLRTYFRVKYVAQDAAYLDGGRSGGLAEGMKLIVRDDPTTGQAVVSPANAGDVAENGIAELEVISVAETSAVTTIVSPKRPVKAGDRAYLSASDQEALVQKNTLSATRKYPTVISFTEGDTLDDEAREEVPRPPLPSVNRARGRIGLDYMGMVSHDGTGSASTNLGLVLRTDITRINGTYWNLSGYWRGRLNSRSGSGQETLQDLINRTYHLSMTYDNPNSRWVAGFGRLYLPYASSLDTIDGGYFGRRVGHGATLGIFAGSTPDPTSWSYDPNRRMGGAFVNFEGGSYDGFHYTSTEGVGLSALNWTLERPFVFLENGLSYKRVVSIYQALQADSPRGNPEVPAPGPGIGRSFTTIRIEPHPRISFNLNHTYFRDLPTFDPSLIGTGLLDKYLFQGFSAGARVEVIKQVWLYTDLGRSNRTGDTSSALNEMFGITIGKLPWTGIRADARYSKFSSAFGDGSYQSISLSRNFGDNLRVELLGGDQRYSSSLATSDHIKFILGNVETNLGTRYFLQGGLTISRGETQKYDQWYMTFGYRFDSKEKKGQ